MRVLLLGCGSRRDRRVSLDSDNNIIFSPGGDWGKDLEMVTVDNVSGHDPTTIHDLDTTPWPFEPDYFDEVHAYEILEHLGMLGDGPAFFNHFWEIYKALKPGGLLMATVPHWASMWALGDPTHRRVINEGSLVFLDQTQYKKQVGVTPMSDLRDWWIGDFDTVAHGTVRDEKAKPNIFVFVLRAVKPPRI